MVKYKNLTGTSTVSHFLAASEFINVQFNDGSTFKYDVRKPGRSHVEEMKRLAKNGQGLATYINEQVKRNFAAKLK